MVGGMAMSGGWTMSMAWMRMPGQSWLGAAASFMGMWLVMMVAMMLPSLTGMLVSYRRALRHQGTAQLRGATVLAGAGYFLVWMLVGTAVYPVGIALAAAEMQSEGLSRLVPLATGAVLLIPGCVQLSGWKARQLALCRDSPQCVAAQSADARSGWAHGLHLGVSCAEAAQHGLQLGGQLIVACAQLHHGRRDGGLRCGASPAAGGVQLALCLGQGTAGAGQVLGQQADLLAVEPGVHTLDQPLAGAVLGNIIFLLADRLAQLDRALLQPVPRPRHGTEFRGQLGPHVGVHCVIFRGRGQNRVLGGERYLQNV